MGVMKFEIVGNNNKITWENQVNSYDNSFGQRVNLFLNTVTNMGVITQSDAEDIIENLIPYVDSPYHGKKYREILSKPLLNGASFIKVSMR